MIHCNPPSLDLGRASFQRGDHYGFKLLAILFACSVLAVNASHAQTKSDSPNDRPFDVGFIGLHGGVYEKLLTHAKPLELRLTYFEDGDIAAKTADLSTVQVLYVQHTREEDRDAYRALIEAFVGLENAILPDGGGEEDEVYDNS